MNRMKGHFIQALVFDLQWVFLLRSHLWRPGSADGGCAGRDGGRYITVFRLVPLPLTSRAFYCCAAIEGGQMVLTEDALAVKEAAAKGDGGGGVASAGSPDKRDSKAPRSRRAIEPVSADEVGVLSFVLCSPPSQRTLARLTTGTGAPGCQPPGH